jgi:hypothetical protein
MLNEAPRKRASCLYVPDDLGGTHKGPLTLSVWYQGSDAGGARNKLRGFLEKDLV